VIAVVALGGMAYAGFALAASDTIVAGPAESYDRQATGTPYNTDQGSLVPFQNLGGSHNVTARQNGPDGKALFRSDTTSGGTVPVNGTQYLSSGDYPFFCTIHPTTMNGTLRVTGAGAPLPRPQATLSVKGKSLAKVIKKGIALAIMANTQIDGAALTAKLGKTTIGKATVSLVAGAQQKVVKLNKAGKSKLRAKGKATVKVTAEIPFGAPATAKTKLK
jgi:plastocyanin